VGRLTPHPQPTDSVLTVPINSSEIRLFPSAARDSESINPQRKSVDSGRIPFITVEKVMTKMCTDVTT
jgi:hypothetical protein